MPIITVPLANPGVRSHHERASITVAAMPPSRACDAEINLYIRRSVVEAVDPERDDGWGIKSGGAWLRPGRTAKLAESTLILASDESYARARWYTGNFIAPTERYAALYEVRGDELVRRVLSIRRFWPQEVISWIRSKSAGCRNVQGIFGPERSGRLRPVGPLHRRPPKSSKLDRGDDHATAARDLRHVVLRTTNPADAGIERW